ncbi:MAG TPA: agmatinase [Terriglobales bacterium]|nr:agmatinase [Terriglobales bacterium]
MPNNPRKGTAWGAPTLLGVPLDANSSYLRGAAGAPPLIREALNCDASNLSSELGIDLAQPGAFEDAGDLSLPANNAFDTIERAVSALLEKRQRPVCLGGDHSITYPIVRAFADRFSELTIIHFDAHPDLYDEFQGSRHSHACPFARVMEEKLAKRLIQIGIRTMNEHQRKQAERFNVEVFELSKLPAFEKLKTWCPVYVSFDMDVLDPAFAPGVSHREPGGISVRDVIGHLHSITGTIVGADLVEYNPARDVSHLTATVAGKILKEILGKMTTECVCPEASVKAHETVT